MLFKTILVAALCTAPSLSYSQDIVSKEQSAAVAAAKCTNGCVILTPAEVAQIEANINTALQAVAVKGIAYGKQSCKNLI